LRRQRHGLDQSPHVIVVLSFPSAIKVPATAASAAGWEMDEFVNRKLICAVAPDAPSRGFAG
jgi:hypothetical protein